jgi:PAS domain-containing protein
MTNARRSAEGPQWLLADNVEHLQLVLQHAALGTFEHDLGSATVRVTPLTCDLYGVPVRDELPLSEMLAQVDPSALSDRERTFSQVLAGEKPFYELQYRVGRPLFPRWLSVRGTVVFAEEGGLRKPVRVLGVVADITEQMHQKQRVEKAQAVLDAIGNSIHQFREIDDAAGDEAPLRHSSVRKDDDASG